MQTLKQKDPLSWLNKIVLGRLVSEMSAATDSQKRNDKRGGAKFSKIDINMNLDPHGRSKGRFKKYDPGSSDVQIFTSLT